MQAILKRVFYVKKFKDAEVPKFPQLFAKTKKVIVCCPIGFWRKGNIDVVCQRYHIKQVETINELVKEIKQKTGSTFI